MGVFHNNIIRATAHLTWQSLGDIENVFHFQYFGSDPLTDAVAMADIAGFLDDAYSIITPVLASSVAYLEIFGFNETVGNPLPVTSWPTQSTGADSGQSLPPGITGLVRLKTGVNRIFGRKYLGPFTEAHNASGYWDSTVVTALAGFGAALLVGFDGVSSGEAWLSGLPSVGGGFYLFNEAVASENPAYQRRRRVGTGS